MRCKQIGGFFVCLFVCLFGFFFVCLLALLLLLLLLFLLVVDHSHNDFRFALDNENVSLLALLDLSAAFDTTDRILLLH